MIESGDPEHPADVLEVLGPGREDLQRDQVLRRDHRDSMTASSDDTDLVQESLLEPWPGEDPIRSSDGGGAVDRIEVDQPPQAPAP